MGAEGFQQLLPCFDLLLLFHELSGFFEHWGSFLMRGAYMLFHLLVALIQARYGKTNAFELLMNLLTFINNTGVTKRTSAT